MSIINEDELINAFKKGEPVAFKQLYREYYQVIYLFSFQLVRDEEQAKDITMSTIAKLFLKKADFDSLANIRGFLYLTAKNESLNYLRHIKIRDKNQQDIRRYLIQDKNPINDEIDGEFIKIIYSLSLNKLTKRMRAIIEMLYEEDLTHSEVAKKLDISPNTVKCLKYKALSRIKKHFDKSGLSPQIKEVISFVLLAIGIVTRN